ncbi:SDR family NAD(P)-dependent oxidoreductase [Microbacterium sp. BWT-B31]|uniref:SDR family NAD(P)-dependent oxidoreductase n=1 Tax=Microbacterium sp. BWT-B31 TaxID=3232072 RepID=UPI003529889C
MGAVSRAVLVTGCSTGIGREIASTLAARGMTVYATARRLASIADLEQSGCRLLQLDVTDEASATAAVETVAAEQGAVGVLVNNAGIQELGAVETVPLERMRALFETNLFGSIRMTQLVLPGMRAQRWGRIVNVGSMNGRWAMPGFAIYAASKHALEAITDAVRYEQRPFGIGISLMQPGMVRTKLGHAAAAKRDASEADPVWADYNQRIADVTLTWEDGPMGRLACSPQEVANAVRRAIEAGRPRTRYRVAASAGLTLGLRKVLPDRAFDAFLRTQFPSPRPPR